MAQARLAVLIDAENINRVELIAPLFAAVAALGDATVRRAYGDWAKSKSWKEPLLAHAIQPVQQFSYVKSKNASDIALVIDAMDLLYSGVCEGFCLVSSDSDFTRLAIRLREAGMIVYGFGHSAKVPEPFRAACDDFFDIAQWLPAASAPPVLVSESTAPPPTMPMLAAVDARSAEAVEIVAVPPPPKPPTPKPKPTAKAPAKAVAKKAPKATMTAALKAELLEAFKRCANKDSQASENDLLADLQKRVSGFSAARPYGYSSLSALLSETKVFDLKVVKGTPNRKRDHLVSLRAKSV